MSDTTMDGSDIGPDDEKTPENKEVTLPQDEQSENTAVVEDHQSSFFGWVARALMGICTITIDAVVKNYKLAISSVKGFFFFFMSRTAWWSKLLWFFPLLIACLAWVLVLLLTAIITPFFVPVGIVVVVMTVCIYVDQNTYIKSGVSLQFTQEANSTLSIDEKGAVLFMATISQMEKELNSGLGWCPNDKVANPFSHLDNRCNRQKGVWYATKFAVPLLSQKITKFGKSDPENDDTLAAGIHFANFPTQWGWMGLLEDAAESHYGKGVDLVKKFALDAKASASDKMVNIRADDLVHIIDVIIADNGILIAPYGALKSRNADVEWKNLDDKVYYAQGAAIVARDIAVALKYTFPEDLARGGMKNLDAAILALDRATQFNPWWISRGEGNSQFADHRTKMQNYYTEAITRLEELRESLKT